MTEKENGGMVELTVGNLVGDTTATTEVIEMAMGWRERWEQRDKMVKEKEKKERKKERSNNFGQIV